ncbi:MULTISPECIES: helix-turn-helix domain-containing protein [Ruegeria]|uniref:MerR family transcriptional regulator n=1 Tax=Ruegeria TaxID=97050 RepID=UPI0014807694|nr:MULTISPECIES: helix-turn-helix domain-containing protein [Ruegeria]NOD48457.1 MerR family transcriptional regulator [Ruegeria sp. HKCCD5849]NOD52477.1 MerR family transcriptional regulator [Ruegeria sp. HKCCD5851]NOD68580.1 MerR family transcriptional regulator [Ruegeria sp. HKCCD7303]NOE34613.1 MerR family transcriptional regulator [Ruegeria sp. HKCCD7318]UWR08456.1 helix-turn-helix domain-containing protein [Ruegeria sp. B32]
MFSIGELSKRTKVKVPTIRYYEEMGLLAEPERTAGNQRRYTNEGLERLSFIRHARDLGFSIEAISSLIELQNHPDRSCEAATKIAEGQLSEVRAKIKRLKALENELKRIAQGCDGRGVVEDCYVLASLADHDLCDQDH